MIFDSGKASRWTNRASRKLKVGGQDSACKCGADAFDATLPENLTQVFRSGRQGSLEVGKVDGEAVLDVPLT